MTRARSADMNILEGLNRLKDALPVCEGVELSVLIAMIRTLGCLEPGVIAVGFD